MWSRGSALVPHWVAFAVTRLLEEHFGRLVDYDFTAAMEGDLDKIADGHEERSRWLQRFYFGDADTALEGLKDLAGDLDEIDAREISTVPLGDGVVLRVGRYGPYVEVTGPDGEPQRATVPDDVAPDELSVEKARELLTMSGDDGRVLGEDPATGRDIVVKAGPLRPVRHRADPGRRARRRAGRRRGGRGRGRRRGAEAKPKKKAAKKTAKKAAKKAAKAAHGQPVQGHVAGGGDPGGRAAAAVAAPRRRQRPGDGRRDHRAERPLRPVPEEGHGLALADQRGAAVRHHAGGGAGRSTPSPSAAAASRRPHRCASSATTRSPASRSW